MWESWFEVKGRVEVGNTGEEEEEEGVFVDQPCAFTLWF